MKVLNYLTQTGRAVLLREFSILKDADVGLPDGQAVIGVPDEWQALAMGAFYVDVSQPEHEVCLRTPLSITVQQSGNLVTLSDVPVGARLLLNMKHGALIEDSDDVEIELDGLGEHLISIIPAVPFLIWERGFTGEA